MTTTIPQTPQTFLLEPLASATDPERVGNKVANLAKAMARGVRVPRGWVIPNEACQQFVERNGLAEQLEAFELGLAERDPAELEAVAQAVQGLFLRARMPAELRAALATLEAELRAGPWVVRSSACGEDSGGAAFPGMLDSILHVRDLAALEEAVRLCWASRWSARCLAYRVARGVDPGGMGVLLQAQVKAAFSGVAFSQAPYAGGEEQILAECCPGLADGLVSGQVTPSSIVIDRRTGTWSQADEGTPLPPAVSKALATELHSLALTLEEIFEGPQDIEWSFDTEGRLFIVQSRPITTLVVDTPNQPSTIYSCANINENYPEPVTPLLFDIARQGYQHYFRNLGIRLGLRRSRVREMEPMLAELVDCHGGRMYYNLSRIHALLRMAPGGEFLAASFDTFTGTSGDTKTDPERTWRGFRTVLGRVGQAAELLRIAAHMAWHAVRLEGGIKTFEARSDAFAADTNTEGLTTASAANLVRQLNRFLEIRRHRWFYPSLADASSMLSYGLLKRCLGRWVADAGVHNRVLQGGQDVVSAQPAKRLWEISRMVREDENLRTAFASDQSSTWLWQHVPQGPVREAFEAYLRDYGFRRSGELLLTRPSFQEEPEAVLDIVRAYAEQAQAAQESRGEEQSSRGESDVDEVLREVAGGPVRTTARRWLLRRLVRWTRKSISRRERARHKQALLYSRVRQIVLRLAERKDLPLAEDAFLLRIGEWDQWVLAKTLSDEEARERIRTRRSELDHWRTIPTPPETLELVEGQVWNAETDEAEIEASGDVLNGTGASSGVVRGPAAVLHDISEFAKLSDGCVLVAAQTDPGWGPAFFRISGLIIERGGMLSHGAILAREYGIPTVVGVAQATRRIPHGTPVVVDGNRGIVSLERPEDNDA